MPGKWQDAQGFCLGTSYCNDRTARQPPIVTFVPIISPRPPFSPAAIAYVCLDNHTHPPSSHAMPHDSTNSFVPRAPRFEVSDPSEVIVTVTRTEDAEHTSFSAKLIDVSQYGTKLQVPVNFRFEESLQLRIEVIDSELEYHGVASVRHIRSAGKAGDEESWIVGCAVAPPLSDETFAYLATAAGKERRQFRRLPIAAKATVRRQMQTEGTTAALHNLSSGGFCFSSSEQYEIGECVQLTITDNDGEPRVIESNICWQVESPDGSIAGCQFASSSSYSELCAFLKESPEPKSPRSAGGEPTSKLVLAAAVLAMFVPPMITLLMQANKVSAEASTPAALVETTLEETPLPIATVDGGIEQAPLIQPAEPIADSAPPIPETPATQLSMREWVDNTGKHRTEAALIEATDEQIVLENPEGKRAQVPWRRLSEADQQYVQAWRSDQQQ